VPHSIKEVIFDKSVTIPNGIDDFWFYNIGTPKQEPKMTNLKLLQIGDINKNKNIETTVKAVKLLNEKGYKVKLDVVGKVKDQKVFKKIKEIDFVNYLGFKTNVELLEIYRNNDIFILPSINETFGLVYAEAMSQGLPVIYSRGQGFDRQFQDGEVGYSVDSLDANDILRRIEDLIGNYELVSYKCIKQCKKFSWNHIQNKYSVIYKSITNL
jgi:glycosyltransferase involved in cell wall biosynthesis